MPRFLVVIFVIASVVVVINRGIFTPDKVAKSPQLEAKDIIQTIFEDGRADSDAATQKHKGKKVTVRAKVGYSEWVNRKSKGPHAILELDTPKKDLVAAFFGRRQVDEVLGLKKGQLVEVSGTVLSVSGTPDKWYTLVIDDCELKDSTDAPPPKK